MCQPQWCWRHATHYAFTRWLLFATFRPVLLCGGNHIIHTLNSIIIFSALMQDHIHKFMKGKLLPRNCGVAFGKMTSLANCNVWWRLCVCVCGRLYAVSHWFHGRSTARSSGVLTWTGGTGGTGGADGLRKLHLVAMSSPCWCICYYFSILPAIKLINKSENRQMRLPYAFSNKFTRHS